MAQSKPILCGSIAGQIGGLGVLMHNAAYKEAGLPYTYVSFEPTRAKEAIEAMKALGIRGMGVTMPYKEAVISYLDKLDETAERIGAVNTIVNDNGVLTGYNTDWLGAINALKEETDLKGKKAALFGAGGVAKAIAYGLDREKVETHVFHRDREKGEALCAPYSCLSYRGNLEEQKTYHSYDLIINATSVGFMNTESLLDVRQFPRKGLVLDVVFKPLLTNFAQKAEQAGCKVVPGWKMLIFQALAQDELYTGKILSFETMQHVLFKS